MNVSQMMVLMFAAATVFTALLFVTPFLEPYGTFTGLDGNAGTMDHFDIWTSTNLVSGAMYAIGDVLCHQIQSRSLMINGSQMAFCIRDTGFMIGLTAGLGVFILRFRDILRKNTAWYAGIVLAVPMAAEWTMERIFGLNVPILRMVTGILAGIGIALIVHKFVSELSTEDRR